MARIGIDARYMENEQTGIGRYSYNLTQHLLRQDRRNTYAVFIRSDYNGPLPEGENVDYLRVPYPPVSLSSLVAMSRRVRAVGPDLWHAHFPIAPLCPGAPTVVTVHDLQPLRVPSLGARRPLPLRAAYRAYYPLVYRLTLSRARAVVAVSEATAREVRQVFGLPRERIRVIHEALDERFLEAGHGDASDGGTDTEELEGLPERFLLYVGATLPHKNLGNLLRGFARALERPENRDLFLVIAGRPSRFEEDWIETARRLGVEDRVRRVGYVRQKDLPRLYGRASLLLHLPRYEGFGFPPLEAMKFGLPVIAADHGSLPEVVGSAGILVDPDDIEGIAAAISDVLGRREIRDRLVREGTRNLERFSWRRAAGETLEIYREILEGGKAKNGTSRAGGGPGNPETGRGRKDRC